MAKFSSMCMLVFLLLVALAMAREFDENPQRRCSQQIQGQRLSSCRQYLLDSSRFTSTANEEGRSWREEFPRCCEELERINEECRCQAVERVADQQRQRGALQGREMQEMLQTAESLPGLCRISPRYCENIRGGSGSDLVF